MSTIELSIVGDVSLKPCRTVSEEAVKICILIMGPTGAGKSTFIEALSGEGHSLGISKDQLEGFTQDVTTYELLNVRYTSGHTFPTYLVDTPGFSDSKISEMEIINKVKQWMLDQGVDVSSILYLSPITDTRVPGSKRRTIKMLKSLLQENSTPRVTVVTTMWDNLNNSGASERAETHFVQLRDDIWKDITHSGGHIARFHNTQDSALEIIKTAVKVEDSWYPPLRPKGDMYRAAPFLYQELLDRIHSCQQELKSLQLEKTQLITDPNPQLEAIVVLRLQEVNHSIAKFLDQLVAFGTPPPGFDGVHEQVVSQYLLDYVEDAAQQDLTTVGDAIKSRLEKLGAFSDDPRCAMVFCACWRHLHADVKTILFDKLVKRIKTRKEEDKQHRLNALRQVIEGLYTSPDISDALSSLTQDVMAMQSKQLTVFYPPPPEFDEIWPWLFYECLLCEVNCYKGAVQIFQDALNKHPSQSSDFDQRYKGRLKGGLAEAKDIFKTSALAVIKYGDLPQGYKRVRFNYRDLSNKGRIAQAKRDVKALFSRRR